jgi:hypothetical protein
MRKAILLACLASLVVGGAAFAQNWDENQVITNLARDDALKYLTWVGYNVEASKEKSIIIKVAGLSCAIQINGTDMKIYTWLPGPADPDKINRWNESYRFARAYFDDEKDICLQYDVDIEPGVCLKSIKEMVRTFSSLLSSWAAFK